MNHIPSQGSRQDVVKTFGSQQRSEILDEFRSTEKGCGKSKKQDSMSNRILVFGEYGIRNGGENSFLSVVPWLKQMGWEFQAAVPENSSFAHALNSIGVGTTNLCFHDDSGTRKSQDEIRSEIARIIDQVQPSIVHCNSLSTSRLCGPVCKQKNIASLGYLRDILKLSRKAISDINELDRIVAVSQATMDWHVEQGMSKDKIQVVHNGVDSHHFSPQEDVDSSIRLALGIPSTSPVLLFVGQIGMRKAVDVLLKVYFRVAKAMPETHLIIVGQRNSTKQEAIDFESELRSSAAESSFADQIHWLGRREDVNRLMRASTILIHPARQEPLGRVLLESAASGLPALTTNVGGSPEIFSSELSELLVPKDDIDSMATKTISLLSAPERRRELAKRCREVAVREFGLERCGRELDQLYRKLAALHSK